MRNECSTPSLESAKAEKTYTIDQDAHEGGVKTVLCGKGSDLCTKCTASQAAFQDRADGSVTYLGV